MLCSICKEKPATVHFTHMGEKMQKLDLCEDCAKAKGFNDPSFAYADLILGLGATQEIEQAAGGLEVKCSRCGFTQADFKKSGRLGCPECYKTFSEGLNSLLRTMHKGTRHVGKSPEAMRHSGENADLLKTLQKKLEKAIESENFEEAAQLRDEIRQMTERSASPKNLSR